MPRIPHSPTLVGQAGIALILVSAFAILNFWGRTMNLQAVAAGVINHGENDLMTMTMAEDVKEENDKLKRELEELRNKGRSSTFLPGADNMTKAMLDGVCRSTPEDQRLPPQQHCVLQSAVSDPSENIVSCSPFSGGNNDLFGLKWCAWPANLDRYISADILKSRVPIHESGPMQDFRSAMHNRTRGIVIDAGAQVGLFSAAALSAGHYTVSIDAREEHVQMNVVSRAMNGFNETSGLVVHGALADTCGKWATMPREIDETGNPGASHIVGRVTNAWPRFNTFDEFRQLSMVPVLTLDHVMEHVMQNLPSNVQRKVYALKMDIEGYEPRALMGAAKLLSHLKPELIVMELFVHRFKDCDARNLITSIAKLGYSVDVSPRLNLSCNRCKNMKFGSSEFSAFLNRIIGNSEMDIVFKETS